VSEAPGNPGDLADGRSLCRLTSAPERGEAVLEVTRDSLEMTDREEFLAGCRRLLATGQPRLVIDLRSLRRIFSVFVGSVMDANARAQVEGRALVVLATEPVAALFRAVVGAEVLNIGAGVGGGEPGAGSRAPGGAAPPDGDR
jgi:hypothetical protein